MITFLQLLFLASISCCSTNGQKISDFLGQSAFSNSISQYRTVVFPGGENVSLTDSLFMNGDGDWVDRSQDMLWDDSWGLYNCYSYAIQRFDEIPSYYINDDWMWINPIRKYDPGRFSKIRENCYYPDQELVAKVESDLNLLGFQYVYSSPLSDFDYDLIEPDDELIAMRTGRFDCTISTTRNDDYHFMRFNKADGSWYHKPSINSVLKYKYDLDNQTPWTNEAVSPTEFHAPILEYSGEIYLFLFTPKTLKPTINGGLSTINIETFNTHDVVVWMDVESDGIVSIDVSGMVGGITKLFDARWNEIDTFSYSTTQMLGSGRYYLTLAGTRYDGENAAVSAHHHRSSNLSSNECCVCGLDVHQSGHQLTYEWKNLGSHITSCFCGVSVEQPHVVLRPGLINKITEDKEMAITLRGLCVLCGGQAQVRLGQQDELIYIDDIEQLEGLESNIL